MELYLPSRESELFKSIVKSDIALYPEIKERQYFSKYTIPIIGDKFKKESLFSPKLKLEYFYIEDLILGGLDIENHIGSFVMIGGFHETKARLEFIKRNFNNADEFLNWEITHKLSVQYLTSHKDYIVEKY